MGHQWRQHVLPLREGLCSVSTHPHTLHRIHTISHVPRGMSPDVWGSSSGRGHVLLSPSSTKHTCTQRRDSDTQVSVGPRHALRWVGLQ